MTSRATGIGLLLFLGGLAVLFIGDGQVATVVATVLLVPGTLAVGVALVRGVDDGGDRAHRNAAADDQRSATGDAGLETRSETGRWPPVIGGG